MPTFNSITGTGTRPSAEDLRSPGIDFTETDPPARLEAPARATDWSIDTWEEPSRGENPGIGGSRGGNDTRYDYSRYSRDPKRTTPPSNVNQPSGGDKLDAHDSYRRLGFDQNGPGEWSLGPVLGVVGLLEANSAKAATDRRFPDGGWDDEGDAFRHAIWSFNLTRALGAQDAKTITDAHEVSSPNGARERIDGSLQQRNGSPSRPGSGECPPLCRGNDLWRPFGAGNWSLRHQT